MIEPIKIRDIEVKPGKKAHGFLNIGQTASEIVQIPVAIVNGTNSGSKLCLTAGVHCTEYEGIEAAVRTYRDTNPAELKGALIICPVINTPGFQHGTMYMNPLDQKNMNRVYPGNPDGTISEKIIYTVYTELISLCEWHIDLHGGEPVEDHANYIIYSTGVATKEVEEKTKNLARYYLTDVVHENRKGRTGNSSSEVAYTGIPSITAEAGGLAAYQEKYIEWHYRGIKNVMKWLGMLPDPPDQPNEPLQKFVDGWSYVRVKNGGIFYPYLELFDRFKKGEVMAKVKDMFGDVIETIIAPEDGIVSLIFPKRVKTSGDACFEYWTK